MKRSLSEEIPGAIHAVMGQVLPSFIKTADALQAYHRSLDELAEANGVANELPSPPPCEECERPEGQEAQASTVDKDKSKV